MKSSSCLDPSMKPGTFTHPECLLCVLLPVTVLAPGAHTLIRSLQVCFQDSAMRQPLTQCPPPPPPPFCLKSHPTEDAAEAEKKTETLKTKRLKEYTVQSRSSTLPNNTYVNLEHFVHVLERISLTDAGLSEVAGANHTLRCDIEALLAIYNDKEAWYKEESDAARKRLAQACYELRKVAATRRLLQENVEAIGANLEKLSRRYNRRQSQLDSLRQELNSELLWLQELMGSLLPDGGNSSTQGLTADEALTEPLHQTCRADMETKALPESG